MGMNSKKSKWDGKADVTKQSQKPPGHVPVY